MKLINVPIRFSFWWIAFIYLQFCDFEYTKNRINDYLQISDYL